jgi:aryl-alcohol dehydrogenase-like predicted oxidoreductase
METVRLGRSGLNVSRLSLGAMGFGDKSWRSWVLDEAEARPIIKRALDLGINLIDTCNFYSKGASEELLGRLLKGTIRRSDVLIATKFGFTMGPSANERGYSRKHITEAVEGSLRRLGIDHIDLYQTHIWDPSTNIEEMVHALADLVRAGKILYVGATDIPAWQFVKAIYIAKAAGIPSFVSLQYHYNAVWREAERELMPFCRDEDIGLLPYSPAARGFLSGRQRRSGPGQTERARSDSYANEWYGRASDQAVADVIDAIASDRGVSPTQVAIAWVLQQGGIHSAIVGATKVEHLDEAVAALRIKLSQEELTRIDAAYLPRRDTRHG